MKTIFEKNKHYDGRKCVNNRLQMPPYHLVNVKIGMSVMRLWFPLLRNIELVSFQFRYIYKDYNVLNIN